MTSSADANKSQSSKKAVSKAAVDPKVHQAASQGSQATIASSQAAAPYVSESLIETMERDVRAQRESKSSKNNS